MIAIDLLHIYQRLEDLGLVHSRREFGVSWCGRGESLVRDFERRGATAVRAKTVANLRIRLREAAEALPNALAEEVREIEQDIAVSAGWPALLKRRAAQAKTA